MLPNEKDFDARQDKILRMNIISPSERFSTLL